MNAHNHGPEEGPGLSCKEKVVGECQKLYTEREVRLREREAFKDGGIYALQRNPSERSTHAEAMRRYPITKKVPRNVRDGASVVWRYEDGHISCNAGTGWRTTHGVLITPERVRILAELMENPWEEISE